VGAVGSLSPISAKERAAELSCLAPSWEDTELVAITADAERLVLLVKEVKVVVPSVEPLTLDGIATGQKLQSCRPSSV